jgi:hypothetical protein
VPSATTLSKSGSLPSGVTFTDNGDGTATLAGTPAAGSGGSHPITITASNGVLPDATQAFTLTVVESPAITSADHTTFVVGSSGTFTVTTSGGFPTPPSLSVTGTLPSGVTFTDNGDGTATLAGTPTAGTAGTYPVTFTASNGVLPDSTQSFTLTVSRTTQSITITSTVITTAAAGGTYTPTATSDSGLPVSYSVAAAPSDACSIAAGVVSFARTGTCTVQFTQGGNTTYAPAASQFDVQIDAASTTTSLTVSPGTAVYGQPVAASVQVAAGQAVPAGTVQFTVDAQAVGSPVQVTNGQADSAGLGTLTTATHVVGAVFTPADLTRYATSSTTSTLTVEAAATVTRLTVEPHALTAQVTAVAPGSGTPKGTVRFGVGGRSVGTALLRNGVAVLRYTTPPGATRRVAAAYLGSLDFTGSSTSRSRHDPSIAAVVSSAQPRSSAGWYRTPVTVRFICATNGAPLASACPATVRLTRDGGGQMVTRTVFATDGGAATVVVRDIDIDRGRPTVHVTGVRAGKVYAGAAPTPACAGHDAVSGIATCRLTTRRHGAVVTATAVATDLAGNSAVSSVTYRLLQLAVSGARYDHGAFDVRPGRSYTLTVTAPVRPRYYDAAVFPAAPSRADHWFHRSAHGQWVLGVTMDPAMRSHRLWNLGVKIGKTMHILRVRVI